MTRFIPKKMTKIQLIRRDQDGILLVPKAILWDTQKKQEIDGIRLAPEDMPRLLHQLEKDLPIEVAAMVALVGHNVVVDFNWYLPPNVTEMPEDVAEMVGILN